MKPREMRVLAFALLLASSAEAALPVEECNIAQLKLRFHMVEGGKKS